MFAFGLAGCGAGSCNSFVNRFGMPLSRNLFLRYKHFIANRAMFAFGLAGFGAGRLNCRINDLGMALGGDLFHTGDDRAADGALCTSLMTGFRAGGRLFSNINRDMPGCVDCFGLGCIANCAGVGLDTGVLTGRGGRDLALIPAVALCRNFFLCNKHFIANRAMFAFGLAGYGAGSCNSFVDDLGMSLGGNSRAGAYFLAAILAVGVAGIAGHGAGCVLRVADFGIFMIAGLGSSPHTV